MANCVQCGRQLPGLTFGKKICQWCVQHEAAQRGEDSPIQRVETAPWKSQQASSSMVVTQAIFGINVAVFIAMSMAAGVTVLGSPAWQALSLRLGANYGPLTLSGQWWRLLACVFIHGGLVHIAFNMWCLWNLGRLAESVYGHWTFAAIYLITGLSSSLMSLAWHFPIPVPSVGASGAIFGIAGALISSFYLGEFSLPRSVMSGMLRSVVAFVGYNLFFGAVVARTDNSAHVGGLLMGLILGALVARVAPRQDDILRRVGVLLVGVLLVYGGAAWLRHSRAFIIHAQNAETFLHDKKTDQAIAELQAVIRQRPDYMPAHYDLARAYWIKGDLANAETELKRMVALDPTDEKGPFYLGMAYLEQKRTQPARDSFTQLLKLNPNSADAYFGLATASSDDQRYSEALEEYKLAAKFDPGYDGVYREMGRTQARLKLYDDAIVSLLKQRQVGDDPDTENLLAAVYEAKGMKDEAQKARNVAKQFQKE